MKKLLIVSTILLFTFYARSDDKVFDQSKDFDSQNTIEDKIQKGYDCLGTHPKLEKARKLAEEAYEMAVNELKYKEMAAALALIGKCYSIQGVTDTAGFYLYNARKIQFQIRDLKGMASTDVGLGMIYFYTFNYKKSEVFLKNSLNFFVLSGQTENAARAAFNLSLVYYNLNKQAISDIFLMRAKRFYQQENNLEMLDLIGQIESIKKYTDYYIYDVKKPKEAIKKGREDRSRSMQLRDYLGIQQTDLVIGNAYLKLEKPDSALIYFREAGNLKDSTQNTDLTSQAYEGMSKAYELLDSSKLSMHYLKKSYSLSDQYASPRALNILSKYEDDYYAFENSIYRNKLKGKEVSTQKLRWILIFSGGGVITLIILFFLIRKIHMHQGRNVIKELQHKLERKDKQIIKNQIQLGNQQEVIKLVYKKLVDLAKTNAVDKPEFQQIINDLKYNQHSFSWDEFEKSFVEVHKDFYFNLEKKYPGLTVNERRLCAFLRLNMTTKEISALTLQSQRAVTMARFRLRQKMGLKKGSDLTAALLDC